MTENRILFAFSGPKTDIEEFKKTIEKTKDQCPYKIEEVTGTQKEELLSWVGCTLDSNLFKATTYFRQMIVLRRLADFFGDRLLMVAMGLLDSDLRS